jgi:hypothetical protein
MPSPTTPRRQEGEEWRVVASRGTRRKEVRRQKRRAAAAREAANKGGRAAAPTSVPPTTTKRRQHQQQPHGMTTVAAKSSSGAATATKRTTSASSKTATLPRTPRTSAVTLTLCEGSKMSYAEVIATARRNVPLGEISVTSVGMRKALTGAIIIKVPGDKTREKAT